MKTEENITRLHTALSCLSDRYDILIKDDNDHSDEIRHILDQYTALRKELAIFLVTTGNHK